MSPLDLRAAVDGLDLVDLDGSGARLRVGGVEVAIRLGDADVEVSAPSPGARPLFVQATLDALRAVTLETSDRGFADALLDDGTRDRLVRCLFGGARAVLAAGRWTIARRDHDVALRELVMTAAWLAARPDAITAQWRTLAARLGASWQGAWDTLGGARLTLDGGVVVDAITMPPGSSETPRLRTVVYRDDANAPLRFLEPWRPLSIAGRDGACVRGRHRDVAWLLGQCCDAAWLWGLCCDADVIAKLAAEIDVHLAPRAAPAAPPPAAIAPIGVADWPASRRELGASAAGSAAPSRWTAVPMPGSDAAIGLDETVDIDGIAVRTQVHAREFADRTLSQAGVLVSAAPRGHGPPFLARPGYRFFGRWWHGGQLGDAAIDDRYLLDADDLPWVRWWLGASERQALLATFDPEALVPFALRCDAGGVRFECGGLPPRRYLDAARQATAFLADRARRAAATWHGLAAALGAVVRGDAWATGGEFALTCERGAARIAIDFANDLPRDRQPRLRTCVRAPRLAEHRRRLVIDRRDLPRHLRARDRDLDAPLRRADGLAGRCDDVAWAEARLAGCATPLRRAAPDRVAIDGADVVLAWEGLVDDAIRLQAAVDAVAYLSVERGGAADGPYR